MRPTHLFASSILALTLTACAGGDRVPVAESLPSPSAPTTASATGAGTAADVSGSWTWTADGQFTVPASVVTRLFGIEADGPITHLKCTSGGTMQVVQSGSTFSGSATRAGGSCETGAGLVFVPPPAAWPSSLPVTQGLVTGRAVHFQFGSVAGLGCPHNGAATHLENGIATELKANGRCIIPGHPQSPAPVDPPPAGTSHDTSFLATRP